MILLKLFYFFNRIFWFPILTIILPIFSKKFRNRIKFERSVGDNHFKSFKISGEKADCAFECSSEGEFEQVLPILKFHLSKNRKVELIYCSESADQQCLELAKSYPNQIRLMRLPLVTYFPFIWDPARWLTSDTLLLCRYDFFPELIFYGSQSRVNFVLVWATVKSTPRGILGFFHDKIYRSFNTIVAATYKDKMLIQSRYGHSDDDLTTHDFRPVQIATRLKNASESLQKKFPDYDSFQKIFDYFPERKRIIFGSFWEIELQAFDHPEVQNMLRDHCLIAIAPHDLGATSIENIKAGLKNRGITYYEITKDMGHYEMLELVDAITRRHGVLLLNLKGVLCELYPSFTFSYIGGGHGVSIHSVLEPYIAGTRVFCGPRVHRSTEYDLIVQKAPDKISLVENLGQLFTMINEFLKLEYTKVPVGLDETMKVNSQVLEWMESKC